jgi:spermidine synthase
MPNIIILTVFIVGLSGLTAQVLLLRELLVGFYGNELTLGLILANWVILEALGVFSFGKIIERLKHKTNVLVLLEIIFSLLLPLSIFSSRTFKAFLGIPFAQGLGLWEVFFVSFLVILPLSFCHGALFSVAAKLYSLNARGKPGRLLGKVYAFVTLGTLIGGIALTYLFIPNLNSFQTVFFISLLNLGVTALLLKYEPASKVKYINLAVIVAISTLFLWVKPDSLHRISVAKQWGEGVVLDYSNSLYGNIVVAKKAQQQTVFYNGSPVITTPYPDITFIDEFGHLPLLLHPKPEDILIIGCGAGGLINEILKHPVIRVDYAELDPLIIAKLKEYPSRLTDHELNNSLVKVINLDGRFFLTRTPNRYDIILIGLSNPSDLATNRLFTQEFFSLAKARLKPGGIISLWLPGSLTYLSSELRDLNVCVLNGLKGVYKNTRLIPGDYNIILASDGVLDLASGVIAQKIKELNIKTNVLNPAYLDYRLSINWQDWFVRSSSGATSKINHDLMPIAVFQMLIFWNKQFCIQTASFLQALQRLNPGIIFVFILILTLVLLKLSYGKPNLKVAYAIGTTGFFGMLINLVLILSFQVFHGYLYHIIGLLIAIFMSGAALGSLLMGNYIGRVKNGLKLFIGLEIAVALFTLILALIISGLCGRTQSYIIFLALFFISGMLLGLEFPLASQIHLGNKDEVGRIAGVLYAADLLGGWFAGISTGIIFLPILGLFNTCMVAVLLKLSSAVVLVRRP